MIHHLSIDKKPSRRMAMFHLMNLHNDQFLHSNHTIDYDQRTDCLLRSTIKVTKESRVISPVIQRFMIL